MTAVRKWPQRSPRITCPGCGRVCRGLYGCKDCITFLRPVRSDGSVTRHPNEDARREALRRTWRANSARQYAQYKELCATFKIRRRGKQWISHFAELRTWVPRNIAFLRHIEAAVPERELVLMRWWLARFPLDELVTMGGAIAMLDVDHSVAASPRVPHHRKAAA